MQPILGPTHRVHCFKLFAVHTSKVSLLSCFLQKGEVGSPYGTWGKLLVSNLQNKMILVTQ